MELPSLVPINGGPKKTFIRRRIESGQTIPSNGLSEKELHARKIERAAMEQRLVAERQDQDRLFQQLQEEERQRQQQEAAAAAANESSAQPPSPSKRVLLIRKASSSTSLPSPLRHSTCQPLSLALSDIRGVGPGSPNFTTNMTNTNNSNRTQQVAYQPAPWEVIGSAGRFRETMIAQSQQQQQELAEEDTYRPEQEPEEKYPSYESTQSDVSASASASLGARLAASAGVVSGGGSTIRKSSKAAAPPKESKTWQHSQFLTAKKQAQAKAINALVSNAVVQAEQEMIARGLPTVGVSVLDALAINGEDLFEIDDIDEEQWYAQRRKENGRAAGGVDSDASLADHARREAAREAKKARKRAAALAHAPFDGPVTGPSLVLSHDRLFFPLRNGSVAHPSGYDLESSFMEDSVRTRLVSSNNISVPGQEDQISRQVYIYNNGTTSIEWKWTVAQTALEQHANEKRAAEARNVGEEESPLAPLSSSSNSHNLFHSSTPTGILLPGESTCVVFTFLPPSSSSSSSSSNLPVNGGLFVQHLILETVPKLIRNNLTERMERLERAKKNQTNRNGDEEEMGSGGDTLRQPFDLTLTGCISHSDTGSIDRLQLYRQLVDWKTSHLTSETLRQLVQDVPEPTPPSYEHRRIFWKVNHPQEKLFFYQELMPEWQQLARDIFDQQKSYLRRTLIWDFSSSMLRYWLEHIPGRNREKRPGLEERFEKLLHACSQRPSPNSERYQVMYGLLIDVASKIPRLHLKHSLKEGTSERLEQDVRKEQEATKKRLEEETRAKLPFHLRGGANGGGANLTPEQRKLREEEDLRRSIEAARQIEEDQKARTERTLAEGRVTSAVEQEIRHALTESIRYMDFLCAPAETNLPPMASGDLSSTLEVVRRNEVALVGGLTGVGVSSVVDPTIVASSSSSDPDRLSLPLTLVPSADEPRLNEATLLAHTPVAPTFLIAEDLTSQVPVLTQSLIHEEVCQSLEREKMGLGNATMNDLLNFLKPLPIPSQTMPHAAAGGGGEIHTGKKSKDGSVSDRPKSGKGGLKKSSSNVSASPESSRPTTPSVTAARSITPVPASPQPTATVTSASTAPSTSSSSTSHPSSTTSSSSSEFSLLASHVPKLLVPTEFEQLRTKSLNDFLLHESRRRTQSSTNLRQGLVFFGNGFVTPDTGLHIPTTFELKLKEERERMARYGQTVSAVVKEAEERRRRDMHPMATFANRQLVLSSASVYFSLAVTREGGVWGWSSNDFSTDPSTSSDDDILVKGLGKSTVGSNTSSSSSSSKKSTGRTKIQEARRNILASNMITSVQTATTAPTTTPAPAAGASKSAAAGANAASSKDRSGKASPRGTPSSSSKSASHKKTAGSSSSSSSSSNGSSSSRPGSGSSSVRGVSPSSSSAGTNVTTNPSSNTSTTIPLARRPLGLLSTADGLPVPIYIPELQGLSIVSIGVGVHTAIIACNDGSVISWEHASRRVTQLYKKHLPGQLEVRVHQETGRLVDDMWRERVKVGDTSFSIAGTGGSGNGGSVTFRPDSASGTTPHHGKKASTLSGSDSSRSILSTSNGRKESSGSSSSGKLSSRKPKKGSNASGTTSANNTTASGVDTIEVLAIDSAAYELEQSRLERLQRDTDLIGSGKRIISVVVGGSGTLSSHIHYPQNVSSEFEFVLILTEDGCVYSSILHSSGPPPPAQAATSMAATPGDAKKATSAGTSAAAAAAAKDKETSVAMLGIGEKTKEALKNEKEKEKAGIDTSAQPIAHFELITTLHPANLTQAAAAVSAGSQTATSNSAVTSSSVPVAGEVRVIQLSVGYGHALALCSDGSVWSWGIEGPHLGLGGSADVKDAKKPRFVPTQITMLSQIVLPQIPTPATATATAVDGAASSTQPPVEASSTLPVGGKSPIQTAGKVTPTSSSRAGGAAAASSSTTNKSLADKGKKGSLSDDVSHLPSGPIDRIVSISSGAFHNFVLTQSGAVFGFGRNSEGQLGLGDMKDREIPTLITHLSPSHTPLLLQQALEKEKSTNNNNHASVNKKVPPSLSSRTGSASSASSSAVSSAGVGSSGPIALSPFLKVVSMAAGGAHSLAVVEPIAAATLIDADGSERQLAAPAVWSFGSSVAGATAPSNGQHDDLLLPTRIPFFDSHRICSLVAGGDASQAIVQREVNNAITLVVDEDDVPDAVLI